MAISPQQLEAEYQEMIEQYEKKIDSMLCTKKITKGQSINIDTPHGFKMEYFKLIRERYLNAGWSDVEYHTDPREDDWLVFKYE